MGGGLGNQRRAGCLLTCREVLFFPRRRILMRPQPGTTNSRGWPGSSEPALNPEPSSGPCQMIRGGGRSRASSSRVGETSSFQMKTLFGLHCGLRTLRGAAAEDARGSRASAASRAPGGLWAFGPRRAPGAPGPAPPRPRAPSVALLPVSASTALLPVPPATSGWVRVSGGERRSTSRQNPRRQRG